MEIRKDIFHNLKGQHREDLLREFVALTLESFNKFFQSEDEIIKYVNNFDSREKAELFLEVGQYYHSAKYYSCHNCHNPSKSITCPHCKQVLKVPSYLFLIMYISIMERLSRDYLLWVDFKDWVIKPENRRKYNTILKSGVLDYKRLIYMMKQRYEKEFGSETKITEFFKNSTTDEEKLFFIITIRYPRNAPELPDSRALPGLNALMVARGVNAEKRQQLIAEKRQQLIFRTEEDIRNYVARNNHKVAWYTLPICFKEEEYWRCYIKRYDDQGLGYCRISNSEQCPLSVDHKRLEESFEKTVRTIYDWRSKFVHDMKMPPIHETASIGIFYDKGPISVELSTEKFRPFFEQMIIRYFKKYQKENQDRT